MSNNNKTAVTSRVVKSIRVSAFHELMFSQMEGKDFPGVLIRLLLDKYFANELPQIKTEFLRLVKEKRDQQKAILATHGRKG